MKTDYVINKISMILIHAGLSVCTLTNLGIFFYLKREYEKNMLDVSMGIEMLEHSSMAVFLVLAIALVFDLHIKRKK